LSLLNIAGVNTANHSVIKEEVAIKFVKKFPENFDHSRKKRLQSILNYCTSRKFIKSSKEEVPKLK